MFKERQILGYFVMFIFSSYVNLVSAGHLSDLWTQIPIDSHTGRALAFLPLLTSSLLSKIGIIDLCSTSAGGEDLSSNAQIRVIGRTEPEICTKMLKTLERKTHTKICFEVF